MNKYLIYRTDRIGDFLLSAILINSIKRNDPESHIIVVCSSKNFNYIKNFDLVDQAILYPEKNFLKKIYFYFTILREKLSCTIVCDGKKRSIYSAIISRSKKKLLITTKPFYKSIFKIFFSKIFVDKESETKIIEIKKVINYLNFNFSDTDLNTINFNKNLILNKKFDKINNISPIIFHFDEKWIHNEYIKSYTSIEPSSNQLLEFLSNMSSTSNKNIIITTGINSNPIFNKIKDKFENFDNDLYVKNIENKKIFLIEKLTFSELQYLVSKSNLIISPHGAITHVAGSLNIPIFDIIDSSESSFFYKWSSHFRNYKKFVRKNFNLLSIEIINSL